MDEKKQIIQEIEQVKDQLIELSLSIHQEPETAFSEVASAKKIIACLEQHGFQVESGIGGLETAFRAEYEGKGKGPTVAFLAEYDALPEIGHGCGHNLITGMSVGAAIGLSKLAGQVPGKIVVMGTPGEEGGGGKIIMIENRCFDDIDFAMMIHPATENLICRGGLATRKVSVSFRGKAAHSSTPEEGVNALQAVIQTFNGIDHLRPLMPLKANINGVILEGGRVPNVIPEYARCSFSVRADTVADLHETVGYVERAVHTAESLTGANAEVEKTRIYTERYPNRIIAERLKENMVQFDEIMEYPDPKMKVGSSDIGNLSLEIPVIHSYLRIAEPGVNAHSLDFTHASASEFALAQMLKGAKALAMTGWDIFENPSLQDEIQKEFSRSVPKYTPEQIR